MDKRALAYSATLGLILAVTTYIMVDLVLFDTAPELAASGRRPLVLYGATAATFAITAAAFYMVATRAPAWIERHASKNPWKRMPLSWDVRSILLAAAVMLACWAPSILVQFPAGMNFDTYVQIYQYLDPAPTYYNTLDVYYDAEYIDHHPVIVTLVYGTFFWIGYALGVQNLGIALAAFTQTTVTALALGISCCYLERLGVPKLFRMFSLFFCALMPFIPLWSMTLMKDSLQAPLFVTFLVCFVEAVRTRGEALRSKGWLTCLVVTGCLVVLTKKTGMGAVIPSLAVLVLCCPRARLRAAVSTVAVPLTCFALVPFCLYPAIGGVQQGGSQEVFGFAYQQVITVLAEGGELSDDELGALGRAIDVDAALERYDPNVTDHVKDRAYADATNADHLAFLGAYLSIGMRHPVAYARSILRIAIAYYAPGGSLSFERSAMLKGFEKHYGEELEADGIELDVHHPEALDAYFRAYSSALDIIRFSPIGRVFLARGFYSGWIPIICIMLCLYWDKRKAVAFLPVALYMATLLIMPIHSPRYMLALLHSAPLMLGLACSAASRASAPQVLSNGTGLQLPTAKRNTWKPDRM